MSEPAVQLNGVSEATDEMRGIAGQALEWVRVSEERVAVAEARAERVHAELKERAMETLRKIGEEGRVRVAAEREKRAIAERARRRGRAGARACREELRAGEDEGPG